MQKPPHSSTDEKMDYWKTAEAVNEGKSASKIELKGPYELAMENKWKHMKKYYEHNSQELKSQMTLEGDTALHIAASCCSKKLGEQVLEFLINLLPTSYDDKCNALRIKNSHGNNVLHEVAVSGNLKAAEFLVSKFNKPPAHVSSEETSSNYDKNRHLLEIRNNLGESPIYRAAALGHTDLVKFFADKLKEENPDDLKRHFHRNDKMSILHIAVIGQHFETAHWLQKNYKFLAQRKDGRGLTSLQLLAQMPTALDPVFQQSKLKMLIYHCLSVGDLFTPNHKDNDVVKDDVESRLGSESDQPPQSIGRKKLPVILHGYTSMWNFLVKENCIIYKIWKDKKNKNYLEELIHLLVKEDYSWQESTPAENKTISLWSEEKHKNNNGECDGGDQGGKGSAEPTKPVGQILLLVEKLDNSLEKLIPLLAKEGYSRQKVYTYTPLLIATITGFVPIVEEILKQHPQAAEHDSVDQQNILHLAIKHRQKKIFKLIESKRTIMSRLNARIDGDGNTILHQAADRSYYSIAMAQKLIGPAMQLQVELRWMLRVKKIVPPHYTMHRNNKNQTAEELFNEQHNDLLKSAQEQWRIHRGARVVN